MSAIETTSDVRNLPLGPGANLSHRDETSGRTPTAWWSYLSIARARVKCLLHYHVFRGSGFRRPNRLDPVDDDTTP